MLRRFLDVEPEPATTQLHLLLTGDVALTDPQRHAARKALQRAAGEIVRHLRPEEGGP